MDKTKLIYLLIVFVVITIGLIFIDSRLKAKKTKSDDKFEKGFTGFKYSVIVSNLIFIIGAILVILMLVFKWL